MSADRPFVSVVIPARNAERTVGDCLASVLRGDHPPDRYEIVVVDNASTDGTAAVVAGYPVRLVRELRRGPAAARNRGIAESSGEIVAFVDADCVATGGWLRELVQAFDSEDVAGVAGEIVPFPPSTAAERFHARRHIPSQKEYLSRSRPFAATANVAFRRKVFDAIGVFDPDLITAEDHDFGWRLFAAGLGIAYSERAIVFIRHRRTRWGLFKQHVGWGYGLALLHRKYGLPWGLRRELRKQAELAALLGALMRDGGRHVLQRRDAIDLEFRSCELLRLLGIRVGGLYGLAEGMLVQRRSAGRGARP